ncbi:hypothetical protein GRJ2_000578200 [Grus japonensis]|uniref:Reverse transcriptase/retrotransposon-derived protein RNase H-like domain-containing protein n=1 Tax=Grus japonensis TaxID=30415 RepID=A0ABC9W6E0_GRUJA
MLWITDYGLIVQPLYEALKESGDILVWTPQCRQAFELPKRTLKLAPALGLPNLTKPFELFVHERFHLALGVLAQRLGSWKRLVGYFSKQLDNVSKGWPSRLRAVAETVSLIREAWKLAMGQRMTIYVPHAVTAVLEQKGNHRLLPSRMMKYQAILLEMDDVNLKGENNVENGFTWSLWQKAPGETRGRPLGFWSQGYGGSEACYAPTEKEIAAACEGVQAALEATGTTEAQLLLAPQLPALGWMFKGRVPSTHHATDATGSKRVAPMTQRAQIGTPNRPGILEAIADQPEGKDFGVSPEEEVARAKGAPPYNKLPENQKQYALFADGSCRIAGKHWRRKAAVWSPTQRVAEAAEGQGESSLFAEAKASWLALDVAK